MSPPVKTELIFISVTLEAAENQDMVTADIPNVLVQPEILLNARTKRLS